MPGAACVEGIVARPDQLCPCRRARANGGVHPGLDEAELSMFLLFAGHETTVQIGFTALLLMVNPEQWGALVDDPDLVPNAVEETLRTSRRAGGAMVRYARTDLDIDGVAIKAGDLVLLEI